VKHLTDVQAETVIAKELAQPQWSVRDWRAYFHERAAIGEYDNGLLRHEAETLAYTQCIRKFLERHPPGYRPDLNCLQCGGMSIKAEATPIICPDRLQRWVHHTCTDDFRLLRIRDAALVLQRLGIIDPVIAKDFAETVCLWLSATFTTSLPQQDSSSLVDLS
jgi:hypothetical protein